MIDFIIHTAEGALIQSGRASGVLLVAAQEFDGRIATIVAPDEVVSDGDAFYMPWNGTEYVPTGRPALLPFISGPAPLTLDMAALPSGTKVTAWSSIDLPPELQGKAETSDPLDPIELADPGFYTLKIEPPFPHKPLTQERFEVTSA